MKRKDCWRRRDIGFLLVIVYLVWKVYVLNTPSPDDDEIPDRLRDAVLQVADTN